jgi:serine/threonine-protein kinase HipA
MDWAPLANDGADGREVGTVHYKNARLSFVYNDAWRTDPNAYPLSLSMPLASAEHGHARIEAFLWGLLPDNDRVLENWGRRFQVSPKNVFRLIAHVGEDCAGAVQFVRPERLEALQSDTAAKEVKWLTLDIRSITSCPRVSAAGRRTDYPPRIP